MMEEIDIKTPDGVADCYAFYPQNAENLPAVLFYMDAFGVRDALFQMAERIANEGYFVLIPDLYYRSGKKLSFAPSTFMDGGAKKDEMMKIIQSLTLEKVMSDTTAYIDYLDNQEKTDKTNYGCTGYCMGGKFSLGAAGTFPEKINAAAVFHGSRLATEQPDSPHRLASKIKANLFIGIAEIDQGFSDEEKNRLDQSLKENHIHYEMKVYPQAKHGFTVLDHMAYDKPSSEDHFEKIFTLFKKSFSNKN